MLRAGLDVWVESEKERRDEKRLGLKALSFVGRCTIYPCCFLFVFLCSQSLASATRSRLSFVRALFSFLFCLFRSILEGKWIRRLSYDGWWEGMRLMKSLRHALRE